jgi:hypothetical protein
VSRLVDFEYDLGERVRVAAIDVLGRVDSLTLDNMGKQYRVVYWNDGQRQSVWVYPYELEKCNSVGQE